MNRGNWRGEAWPGPATRAGQTLPRVEDLPAASEGYDGESVRAAFDSFYRHIARLDSTLRALEAVEVFREQAGELRTELRALRAAGWAQLPWPTYAPLRVSPGLPEWLPRLAIETAFLLIVAVVVAVAGFDGLSIVLAMALAWAIVGVVEWSASRERFARRMVPAPERKRARVEGAPAPVRGVPPEPAAGDVETWAASSMRVEAAEDEARTLVRPDADEQVPAPWEPREAPPTAKVARGLGWRGLGRRRIVLVGLVAVALPAGIAPASLFLARRDGQPTAAQPPIVRQTPKPRAVSPEAIGRPKNALAPLQTNAVVQASRGDSWVEVRASSSEGKELFSGMLVHGRLVRTRSERVWLRLGAASNVDVRVNGRQIGRLFGTVAVLLTPRGVVAG